MKNRNSLKIVLIIVILSMVSFILTAQVSQLKRPVQPQSGQLKKQDSNQLEKKDYTVKQLPDKAEKIIIEGTHYYVHNGIYYRQSKRGYRLVKAPYGLKIGYLPDGVRIIRRHGREYYYYFNTFYRYDRDRDIYIVIEAPDWAERDIYSDKLNLMNGSVLIGRYMGGDRDEVRFRFNGETHYYPVEEIISVEFAPPIYEGSDY